MMETISAIGLIMFIFGMAGTMWYDNGESAESRISGAVFMIGIILVIIGFVGSVI